MLEQVQALPRTEGEAAAVDRDAQMRLRQRRTDMRGHVVGPFRGVAVIVGVLRHQSFEEIGHVGGDIGVRVLLYDQRSGSMPAEDGQQPGLKFLRSEPPLHVRREIVKAFAACRNSDFVRRLAQTTQP